jgi:hypothetical protein
MRFSVDHDFPAEPKAVMNVLCDPTFQQQLALPDLSLPTVVDVSTAAGERVLKLRYEFVGHLDPIARKVLGSRKLTWVQELRMDSTSLEGALTFAAEADPNRMHGSARITLTGDGNRTHRHMDGELIVRVPLIGGTAEKRIVPGLVRRLDVEAAALTKKLTTPGGATTP